MTSWQIGNSLDLAFRSCADFCWPCLHVKFHHLWRDTWTSWRDPHPPKRLSWSWTSCSRKMSMSLILIYWHMRYTAVGQWRVWRPMQKCHSITFFSVHRFLKSLNELFCQDFPGRVVRHSWPEWIIPKWTVFHCSSLTAHAVLDQ